jgi:hypothetical protein
MIGSLAAESWPRLGAALLALTLGAGCSTSDRHGSVDGVGDIKRDGSQRHLDVGQPEAGAGPEAGQRPEAGQGPEAGQSPDAGTPVPDGATGQLAGSITKDGVTWTFAKPAVVGQFVTGDYWVVGPVTVTAISPPPGKSSPYMNGTVKNMPFKKGSGFDQRLDDGVDQSWWFDASLRQYPPISLVSGDTLVSSISFATPHTVAEQFSPWDKNPSPIRSYSILTVVAGPVSSDAFRPSYCDRGRKYHYASKVNRGLLPALKPPNPAAVPALKDFEAAYRRPWIDTNQFNWDVPGEYMPGYGHHVSLMTSYAVLLLTLDLTPASKVNLTNYLVQYGIDTFGCVGAGVTHPAFGGHGNGRKLPVIFAGVLLNDAAMKNVSASYPDSFSEDMQTVHVNKIPGGFSKAWQGATVIYGGHLGVRSTGVPVDTTQFNNGSGPYEQLAPGAWPVWSGEQIGEAYRRCCTSTGIVAEALAARLLGKAAVSAWNYPAFFDYADRWMTEDDTQAVADIKSQSGFDYSASWARQKQTLHFLQGRIAQNTFIDDMWSAYRSSH